MANKTIAEVMTTPPRRVNGYRPRTAEEAKGRFMVAASRLGPGRAIQSAPWKSVGLALGTGILLGYSRPLRHGLVQLGKLSVNGMISAITYLWPSPLAESKNRYRRG
jgi:hypothetical protein